MEAASVSLCPHADCVGHGGAGQVPRGGGGGRPAARRQPSHTPALQHGD